MKRNRKIYVTREDVQRLESVLAQHRAGQTSPTLEDEIARAEVVAAEEIPPSVVTMNSQVKYRDKDTGAVHEVALVYPHEADIARKKVSILAPVGIALLGLSVGQAISYRVPDGREKTIEVLAVTFQPESDASPKRQAAEESYSSAA